MTVMVMALLTVNESEPRALAEYFKVAGPLMAEAGARIVKRFNINEAVVGRRPAITAIMVEYPNRAAVDLVFQSEAYKGIGSVRDRAFSTYDVSIVAGMDEPHIAESESDQN